MTDQQHHTTAHLQRRTDMIQRHFPYGIPDNFPHRLIDLANRIPPPRRVTPLELGQLINETGEGGLVRLHETMPSRALPFIPDFC